VQTAARTLSLRGCGTVWSVPTITELPAIFITAHDDEQTRSLAEHACLLLQKPFEEKHLLAAIERAMKSR